ncbi:hypothetical protein [Pseudomonas farris]
MSRISFSNKTSLGLAAIALAGGMSLASSAAFAVEALPQGAYGRGGFLPSGELP